MKTKKIITYTLAGIVAFGGATTALALSMNISSPSMKEMKSEIKDVRKNLASSTKEMRGDIKETRMEAKDKIKDIRENAMKKHLENRFAKMKERFQATIERLDKIMLRVNSRIEKIKNGGGNTTIAEKFVADAKTELDVAKALLLGLSITADTTVTLEASATSTTRAKVSLEALRKSAKELEAHLKNIHNNLEKAVGSLKGQSQLHATSTMNKNENNQSGTQN